MKKPNLNTLFLIIATIILLGGLYWYFFSGDGTEPPLSMGVAGSTGVQAQFETLIGQLEPIAFDLTVLSDPRFNALVDLSTPVTPELSGRTDPFAPVPGVSNK
ncbi:MAG: hypothetical protein Q8P36_00850 [bacterium]|nr:hypothetical protein [bacterium]